MTISLWQIFLLWKWLEFNLTEWKNLCFVTGPMHWMWIAVRDTHYRLWYVEWWIRLFQLLEWSRLRVVDSSQQCKPDNYKIHWVQHSEGCWYSTCVPMYNPWLRDRAAACSIIRGIRRHPRNHCKHWFHEGEIHVWREQHRSWLYGSVGPGSSNCFCVHVCANSSNLLRLISASCM